MYLRLVHITQMIGTNPFMEIRSYEVLDKHL